jgi:hypothetical protein
MKNLAFLLVFFHSVAFSKCLFGVGVEGNGSSNSAYSEQMAGQMQRSFKTVAIGAKCGDFTLSTTDLGGINDGYDIVVGGREVHVDASRWTFGYNVYKKRIGDFEVGLGGSVSKVNTYSAAGNDSYWQPHAVLGFAHKRGVAVFSSFGKRDGSFTSTVGVYLYFKI